jgi:hypothetical protein
MGVEVQFKIPPAAGLSLENDIGAGGGGDMTEVSLGISCFLQLFVSAVTEKHRNNGRLQLLVVPNQYTTPKKKISETISPHSNFY